MVNILRSPQKMGIVSLKDHTFSYFFLPFSTFSHNRNSQVLIRWILTHFSARLHTIYLKIIPWGRPQLESYSTATAQTKLKACSAIERELYVPPPLKQQGDNAHWQHEPQRLFRSRQNLYQSTELAALDDRLDLERA